MHDDHDPVSITFAPERWPPGTAPPAVRIRRLLKVALRSFGLKCTNLETPPDEDDEPLHKEKAA